MYFMNILNLLSKFSINRRTNIKIEFFHLEIPTFQSVVFFF